ncbi:hypothetical protein TYRP_020290 [Tyrophagus putrescentiae]|nr:hypothetical protein TYRP_020290 [Tyrophagus putrescentiae]
MAHANRNGNAMSLKNSSKLRLNDHPGNDNDSYDDDKEEEEEETLLGAHFFHIKCQCLSSVAR